MRQHRSRKYQDPLPPERTAGNYPSRQSRSFGATGKQNTSRPLPQPLADKNSNAIEVHIASDLSPINADATRLKQCLLNLLSNACKFTQSGRVTLSVVQQQLGLDSLISFYVEDTGVGLSDEQAARLFQPFSQADASTTRKFGGTGLGLAITKKLCEAMGGNLTLQSQLGVGSTFTIELPVCPSARLRKLG